LKLHPPLFFAVCNTLKEIFEEKQHADKVIERILKSNQRWGARDRAFIAQNTYDIVRNWRLVTELIPKKSNDKYAAAFAVWFYLIGEDLPDWEEYQGVNKGDVLKGYQKLRKIRAIRESVPDWLDKIAQQELGNRWETELIALNQQAPLVIRVNTLKTSVRQVIAWLKTEGLGFSTHADVPEALILDERINLFRTELFKEGWVEVQDTSSQRVAHFCEVEPGMRVIDACAGGGGKSLHLAALMKNKGRIVAMDVEEWKLKNLRQRFRRAGIDIIETKVIEGAKTIKRLKNTADRLLLDVPCSGLGVLKRNPDAKWKLSPESIEQVIATQREILGSYHTMVKPGGKMIYVTCSILPSENIKQVEWFLAQNQDFHLDEYQEIWPSDGFDGFFMAILTKKAK
jgi:16S rRNA (cytosine967-C5)-methyltransferase